MTTSVPLAAAPLHTKLAEGPDGGIAHWLTTSDGLRIRVAHWGLAGAKGTVLLFPGRTEYCEKYGRAAADLADRGYATLTIDWRGQGLAQRILPERGVGHVTAFEDYQQDVAAAVAHAKALNMPRPWYLVAHSMGGCIGLRALREGLDVNAVAFTAPMWGIQLAPHRRTLAWGVSSLSRMIGQSMRIAPGQSADTDVHEAFADNELTSDPEMFDYMNTQIEKKPDLALGGPSLHWLNEALRETRRLHALPSPDLPCVVFLGDEEYIVDSDRITDRMKRWPKGELMMVPGAKHEVMMEIPLVRERAFDAMVSLFEENP